MNPIRRIGRFLPKDSEGNLLNDCSEINITPPWSAALDDTVAAYLRHGSDEIHSLYVRGSIPRGLALPGSDLDTIAILKPGSRGLPPEWVDPFVKEALRKYPFVSRFEFNVFRHGEVMNEARHFNTRFVLKTLSLCVWGDDLAAQIAPFQPNLKLGISFHANIDNEVKNSIQSLGQGYKPELCQWIMKRLVRTGFCLTLDREREFTRDLYPCWEAFSKYYPEKSQEMKQALEWAIQPPPGEKEVVFFLESFGSWLVSEAHWVFFGYSPKPR